MKDRLLLALLSGTTAYIIAVLSGVLLNLSLGTILLKGIIALFLVGTGSWFLIFVLTKLPRGGKQPAEVNKDFSALDPPVIETVDTSEHEGNENS